MDGVLTRTATVHAAAWKTMFDEFLRAWAEKAGEPFVPFDPVADYDRYVDGRRRLDGTRTFLTARKIAIPEGSPQDPADALTLHGLGERKNQLLLSLLASAGGFTPVIGVDRTGQAEALRANGADIVVTDLADLMEA
jgi:beta-phosphoglucomutase-like phosphatase (HAD superfamily)